MPRAATLERNQLLMESAETRAARGVAAAYNQARRELTTTLIERWTGTATLTPTQQADLLRRLGLLQVIDGRLLALEQQVGVILRDALTASGELALEQVAREIVLLPPQLRPSLAQFSMLDTELIERFIPAVTDEIHGITQTTMVQLRRELQSGLVQGESFDGLVRRLMAQTPTGEGPAVWRNGELSAERMARRTVITANNASKEAALARVNASGVVRVQKQAVASIGPRTTQCCLRVHGQIRDVGEPFELTGEPRFARQMMHPSFHWNCRTTEVMYHPAFEQGGLTTANMRSSAAAELRRRGE
jgi:hypothetical protein